MYSIEGALHSQRYTIEDVLNSGRCLCTMMREGHSVGGTHVQLQRRVALWKHLSTALSVALLEELKYNIEGVLHCQRCSNVALKECYTVHGAPFWASH